VTFNGIPATVLSWSAASIEVTVPDEAATGNVAVVVTTAGLLVSNTSTSTSPQQP
jgi:uncharacterized protein (TIGR03437 family)